MKTTEAKPASSAAAKTVQPFFNKEGGALFSKDTEGDHGSFFSSQKNSFFKPNRGAIQAKLTIGQPGDQYEQEADHMADKVVQRLNEPGVQAKAEKNNFFSANKNGTAIQQKTVAPIASSITPLIQTKCASCEQEEKLQKKEEENEPDILNEKLQKKPIFESNAEPPDDEKNIQRKCAECEKEEKVQKKEENNSPETAPVSLETVLPSSKENGSPSPQNKTLFSNGIKNHRGSFFSSQKNPFFKINKSTVQAKLTIGQPNDKYEQEADHMADKVVQRLSEPNVQSKPEKNNFFSANKNDTAVQQKPVAPIASSITPLIQTKCATCDQEEKLQKKEEENEPDILNERLQKKPIFESNAEPPDDENNVQLKDTECEQKGKLQNKLDASSTQTASAGIEGSIASSKGSGNALPDNTRQQMESSFNADFSNVRIHNDSSALKMSADLGAQAFTHGNDIYFNTGKYDSNSNAGKHLLAHELTHVMQQNGDTVKRACDPTISSCIPQSYNSCNPAISSCPPPVSSQEGVNPMELNPGIGPGSFSLIPITNPPPSMIADIPEGTMATYNAIPVPESLSGNIPSISPSEFIGPGSAALNSAINQSLMTTGFATIQGGNGIGMIAIPNPLSSAGLSVPESMSGWGHTAVYVRINGQITLVRGFTVNSLLEGATNQSGVLSGAKAIPGTISNDLGMFTITNARTVEWPVTAETAQGFADSLPAAGAPPPGGPNLYTGKPGVYGPGASNCVGWACGAVEDPIGGKVGTSKLGNIAEPAEATAGLQGRMMQLTKAASSEISPGGAVAGGMPTALIILKWGGRLFMVVGAAITVKQILSAQGEHKREIQGEAFGAFAGGVTVGAFTAGLCIGLGIFTAGVALLACAGVAAVAGIGGAVGGHYLGGAVGSQFDNPGNIQKKSLEDSNGDNKKDEEVSTAQRLVQRKCAECEQEQKLQKKEEEKEEDLKDNLQKEPIFETRANPTENDENIQRKCAECERKENLQKKSDKTLQPASPNIESSLSSSKGSGLPLPENTRDQMESSFGADFSSVRIHNNSTAAQMSKDLGAQAFTYGSDIYFNSGKYDTGSNPGKHLLGHELTHVVQQGASKQTSNKNNAVQKREGSIIQAKCNSSAECLAAPEKLNELKGLLIMWVNNSLQDLLLTPESLYEKLININRNLFPEDALQKANDYASVIAYMTWPYGNENILLTDALKQMLLIQNKALENDQEAKYFPHGLDLVIGTIGRDIVNYLLGALEGATDEIANTSSFAETRLYRDLDKAIKMVRDPVEFMNVELEGTIQMLIDIRYSFFKSSDQNDRKNYGAEIGRLSREAILINDAIQQLKSSNTQPSTPLDTAVMAQLDKIKNIRETALTEDSTKQNYKDDITLLGQKNFNIDNPIAKDVINPDDKQLPNSQFKDIQPDEAFPVATNEATTSFVTSLSERIASEKSNVDELKKRIIPPNPTFEMVEFAEMYKKWYSFISHEREKQNLMYQFFAGVMMGYSGASPYKNTPGMYQLAGIDTGSGFGNVEGSLVRGYMMDLAKDNLGNYMERPSEDFATELENNTPQSFRPDVTGTASRTDYQFGQRFYDDPNTKMTSENESRNREIFFKYWMEQYSQKFNEVEKTDSATRPEKAITEGILQPNAAKVPITPMRQTNAQEGWNFLVNVYDDSDPMNQQLVLREQKTMPPEIMDYFLARKQLYGTISQRHIPKSGSTVIGDFGIRGKGSTSLTAGGIEEAKAISKNLYVNGELDPRSEEVDRLKSTIASAKNGNEVKPGDSIDEKMVADVIGELSRYFEMFYAKRIEPEWRISSVLIVGNIEFHIGDKVKEMLDPVHILKVMGMSFGISVLTSTLSAFGEVGELVSAGIHAKFSADNVTDLSAMVGLALFLRNAAETDSVDKARVQAVVATASIGDLQQLFESLISMPASMAGSGAVKLVIDRFNKKVPSTTKELADACGPLLQDPVARKAIQDGLNHRLAEMEAQGITKDNPNDEFKTLDSFRDYVGILDKMKPDATKTVKDVPLIHAPEKDITIKDVLTIKTAEDMAVLREALPPELRDKVDVYHNNKIEGTGVHIYYNEGNLRLEIGSRVGPEEIKEHVTAIKELMKYQGVGGAIRRLILRIFKLDPPVGSKGFEAKIELPKLEQIIEARYKRLSDNPHLAKDSAETEAILKEIDDLNRQYLDHLENVNSFEKGTGYVAAQDNVTAGEQMRQSLQLGPAPDGYYWRKSKTGILELVNREGTTLIKGNEEYVFKYDPVENKVKEVNVRDLVRTYDEPSFVSTNWDDAFKELAGNDDSSSFGIFVKKLNTELGIGIDQVIEQMKKTESGQQRGASPEDLTMRTVRHSTKQAFINDKILPHLTDLDTIKNTDAYVEAINKTKDTTEAYRQVSHQRMIEYTNGLDSADRGSISESWYDIVYGKPGDATQVNVTPSTIAAQGGIISGERVLDRVGGDTITELKNVTDSLGPRDKKAFEDQSKMLGYKVDVVGKPRIIRKLNFVILDPNGAYANREWMKSVLEERSNNNVTFTIFNSKGEKMDVSKRVNKKYLNDPDSLKTWLGIN